MNTPDLIDRPAYLHAFVAAAALASACIIAGMGAACVLMARQVNDPVDAAFALGFAGAAGVGVVACLAVAAVCARDAWRAWRAGDDP